MIVPNGTHGEQPLSDDAGLGQELYQNEIANIGSPWYMNNNYDHREASMEEIFHMVHDSGIGTSQNPQVDAKISKKIAKGTLNALPKDKKDWGKSGLWGVYTAKTREAIKEKDPMGYDIITSFLPKYINTFMPVDESFAGTFDMNYDASKPYTSKSRYLQHLILQGDNNADIIGNDQDNIFMGNAGINNIDGGRGRNIVQLRGASPEYTITDGDDGTITVKDSIDGRDGQLILKNIQVLRFTDKEDVRN